MNFLTVFFTSFRLLSSDGVWRMSLAIAKCTVFWNLVNLGVVLPKLSFVCIAWCLYSSTYVWFKKTIINIPRCFLDNTAQSI